MSVHAILASGESVNPGSPLLGIRAEAAQVDSLSAGAKKSKGEAPIGASPFCVFEEVICRSHQGSPCTSSYVDASHRPMRSEMSARRRHRRSPCGPDAHTYSAPLDQRPCRAQGTPRTAQGTTPAHLQTARS